MSFKVKVQTTGKGIGGHQSAQAQSIEWLTPPHILAALGPFDLDPCAPLVRPWDMAARHYTIEDDGLIQPWEGRIWLNPPYGVDTWKWLNLLALHENGIALIFARTETEGFFRFGWNTADAMLFLQGRLTFHYPDGSRSEKNAGAPSVLIAYGSQNADRLESCDLLGYFVRLKKCELNPTRATS